jgi:hypothetical protein
MRGKGFKKTYFRSHEFRGTAEGAGGGAIPHLLLAETIIGNLDVSIKSQEDVVELQITVDDTILVEVLEGETDLGSVEPRLISRARTELQILLTVLSWCRTVHAGCAT